MLVFLLAFLLVFVLVAVEKTDEVLGTGGTTDHKALNLVALLLAQEVQLRD